ncbi:unnamed protein product [Clonostachys rosea f. rosea IK726]|uniref:DJ-1/PfpI domain-containing protein n=2 Tax=Bionectria ochroleuca TaxID=29856 RepID=A0A0B7JNB6_BIOOC|nr:unnamed protein product [Clonostachys rosea f. rosea IK726]
MSPSAPLKFAVALFEGFQALDVFGPLDMLNQVSKTEAIEFVVLGHTLNPISTLNKVPGVPTPPTIGQSVVPTHTFDDAPDDIEVLLVPGGIGARDLEHSQKVVDFIRGRYPKLKYLLTVCTGSALAARAGVLDGREATSNKKSFKWVVSQRSEVKWVQEARWVVDGNIWTSSGISAGIDMMLAFIKHQFGDKLAEDVAIASEYVWNKDSGDDRFAKYWL